jgi:linoleoyl-CoA desaturase
MPAKLRSPVPATPAATRPLLDAPRVKFAGSNAFQSDLRQRVDNFFSGPGARRRDLPVMYLKTAIYVVAFVGLYVLLVFAPLNAWQAVPVAVLLGLATAGIGFNVQHDGGHEAYSERRWVNRLMALMLDVIGGSSYIWHYKHGVYHHTYVNITHEDTDVDLGFLGRLTPHQRRYCFHRWQHLYIWPLYGLAVIKWQLSDDYRDVILSRVGEHRIPSPRGWDLVVFVAGKLTFLGLAFGLPLLVHPWSTVLLFYVLVAVVLGSVLSTIFQLAHAVDAAEFPMPQETGAMESAWAVHQVQTTVDFARHSRLAAWLLGGLNFQIEHHLLPKVCHVNYPALSEIVRDTCQKHGLKYNEHPSVLAGLASHYRWLRKMGAADAPNH